MKKLILLLLISGGLSAQVVIPKSTTTFSNVRATGSMTVANKLRVGSTTAPSATLDVTGNGAFTQSVAINTGSATTIIGSLIGTSSVSAIYCGTATPSSVNYVLNNNGGSTALNGISNSNLNINNTTIVNAYSSGIAVTGLISATGNIASSSKTAGIGYAVGSGSTVTQTTSRTTGVTINAITGAITLVSAAGSTSWQTFTVSNTAVAAKDVIIINQKSGTDLNEIHVTAVGANSFNVTFRTTGGTTVEQPVFNFAVIKGQTN